MPTQQPLTKILVALGAAGTVERSGCGCVGVCGCGGVCGVCGVWVWVRGCGGGCADLATAEGAISSRFSMLHSSKNSKMGLGCEPTLM